jgi:putative ABC transport system substrate-binding protein
VEAFRRGLRELGYAEGKNIAIEYRAAEGKLDRLPALAAELVGHKIDVIVVGGDSAIRAARQATYTIPIVMANAGDPVTDGFVASLAQPGGNITGLSRMGPELSGKRLELLKEAIPKASRVAVLWDPNDPGSLAQFRETEAATRALRVQLQSLEVRGPDDFENAFRAAGKGGTEALIIVSGGLFNTHRARMVNLEVKTRLPVMHTDPRWVSAGGLMSYSANVLELFRGAATYVDKILKGAKPADLPVEQPTKFEFIINLKTAKQIGLTIPPNVLARADKVIR